MELSPAEFNFETMLRRAVDVINFRVNEKQQSFSVNIDSSIPVNLIGDDQRLSQVITNLLSNAVKFTQEYGTIRLNTRLVNEADGRCVIEVKVIDDGIGISPEQQARLFSSFQQAENSTSRKFGGTGLGLTISKHIVEMMGGSIWIESELGRGATFGFLFEMRAGSPALATTPDIGARNSALRLLLVDDMPDLCLDFKANVARLGFSCDTAHSAAEAIEVLGKNSGYDLIFVDHTMPGMDGLELALWIKENLDNHAPIVLTSSADWTEIEAQAREVGIEKHLSKPFFRSAIEDCIVDCLGQAKVYATEPSPTIDSFADYCIILAEDVDINREIVLALLEPTNLKIDCAENGEEAVRLFVTDPARYDMILMDLQMPKMDGLEATRCIRALPHIPSAQTIPIVAMTANAFREDIERCMAVGMVDHIGKPIDFDVVLEKLRMHLGTKQ